jgi:GDP-L-fucose synthase
MTSWLASKRVMVTGGAGFLGRHVVQQLETIGVRDLLVPRIQEYDLTRSEDVARLFEEFRPDVVIHLAAKVGGIVYNLERPAEMLYENTMMGLLLLEQARRWRVSKFVAVSSACAYPKEAVPPFREDTLWEGYPDESNGPYGVAKRLLVLQAQVYRRQYQLNAISLIPTNLYGPADNFDPQSSHVVPALIRKFLEAKEEGSDRVVVWGTGRATRDFLYVGDCAQAVALAAEKYDKPEPVNIGTGREVTIRELAETIAELMGYRGAIVWDPARPEGQPRRVLDVSRAEAEFGFRAGTPLEVGLQKTIEWFLDQRLGGSVAR